MRYSFKIGSAWGIPIELHFTFILLILAVFVLSLLNLPFYTVESSFYMFFIVVFLFVFVFFHELAHSVVARRYGIKVRKIVLYPIGGVSEIEEIPDNPAQEWRMAFAGPLTSLVLGFALLGVSSILTPNLLPLLLAFSAGTGNIIFDLAILNILLGVFNLIPAFPMDGGRVFRAVLAERMKYSDATRYAVTLGRILGFVMVIVGFIFNFLLILVGLFVYIGASEEGEQTIISTKLAGVRVKDVMHCEVGFVSPQQTLTEALEVMFKNRYHDALVEKDGVFLGMVTWAELMKVSNGDRDVLHVAQMPLKKIIVYEDESILEANKVILREKLNILPVVQKDNPDKVVGVLTSEAISNAYDKARNR
ncbi:MAG: site-2 protease family protein [Candidatus Bathyarchaeota archaeon]|nr:site-2 protease family protein [Candidatus Bathyarchaeota archaeon]